MLLAAGLVTWSVTADDPYVAPLPAPGATRLSPAAAAEVLGDLVDAVTAGDEDAARALGADPAAGDLLAAVTRNATALELRDFSLRFVDAAGAPSTEGEVAATVDATWAFGGFDPGPARAEVLVGLTVVDGETRVAGLGGGDRVTPLWLAGPVVVRRASDVLVLVEGEGRRGAAVARRYLGHGRAAVPAVRRVLPQWRGPLVIEVPATERAFDRALDAEPGDYSGIAAVTANPDLSGVPGAPVHVFVNPAQFDRLRERGAQVVVTHEAAHVATDAASSQGMPVWLLEGFADYVALRDLGLPEQRTAAQVITQVREDGVPDALPGPLEFDGTTGHAGAAYEASWMVCRVLAERSGESALVDLYEQVRDGAPLATVLEDDFAWSEADLVRAWQERLAGLAA